MNMKNTKPTAEFTMPDPRANENEPNKDVQDQDNDSKKLLEMHTPTQTHKDMEDPFEDFSKSHETQPEMSLETQLRILNENTWKDTAGVERKIQFSQGGEVADEDMVLFNELYASNKDFKFAVDRLNASFDKQSGIAEEISVDVDLSDLEKEDSIQEAREAVQVAADAKNKSPYSSKVSLNTGSRGAYRTYRRIYHENYDEIYGQNNGTKFDQMATALIDRFNNDLQGDKRWKVKLDYDGNPTGFRAKKRLEKMLKNDEVLQSEYQNILSAVQNETQTVGNNDTTQVLSPVKETSRWNRLKLALGLTGAIGVGGVAGTVDYASKEYHDSDAFVSQPQKPETQIAKKIATSTRQKKSELAEKNTKGEPVEDVAEMIEMDEIDLTKEPPASRVVATKQKASPRQDTKNSRRVTKISDTTTLGLENPYEDEGDLDLVDNASNPRPAEDFINPYSDEPVVKTQKSDDSDLELIDPYTDDSETQATHTEQEAPFGLENPYLTQEPNGSRLITKINNRGEEQRMRITGSSEPFGDKVIEKMNEDGKVVSTLQIEGNTIITRINGETKTYVFDNETQEYVVAKKDQTPDKRFANQAVPKGALKKVVKKIEDPNELLPSDIIQFFDGQQSLQELTKRQ